MNNYNPYSSIFKDERIQFIEESFVGRNHIVKVQLIIKEVNICPNCGSTEVIAYGSKTRNIKMSILTDFDSTIIMHIIDYIVKPVVSSLWILLI